MNSTYDYLWACVTVSPLIFFIIAVSFRLLDNSSLLFLQKEILVNSSNVSIKSIQEQIQNHPDATFRRQLKRALVYRKLHRTFIWLMILSLPVMIFCLSLLY
ncbi:hypothetical protein RM553_05365 [Zunongwangia sp. F363]|uniref:Uncharacterized protein n=1 Tax=Autumnicola tepida TaxID=3075595 RepID=A0ABU3C7E7_9FLAO|nr:hypothetical protein [Zunongwangia sp. F363]MDT0642258.1 hypothetical protein [Zunongwangia sp. F363]